MANITVKHIANMRDLGGLPAADGKVVAPGRLVRGGHLHKIKGKDAEKFRKELGVVHIIDLRSPSELEEKPDVVPEGIKYSYFPSLTNEQNPSINKHNRTSELKRIMKTEGGAIAYLSNIYRLLISQELSIKSHRNVLLSLLEQEEGAIYWHCTQGKDRTGVAAAVILMALGVSREDIIQEYVNEKRSLIFRNNILTTLVGIVLFNRKAKTSLSVLMNAKRPCIEAAFDEMEKIYGDGETYIREALGITDEQIEKLRSMYLVKC